jgi:hypothetical protein
MKSKTRRTPAPGGRSPTRSQRSLKEPDRSRTVSRGRLTYRFGTVRGLLSPRWPIPGCRRKPPPYSDHTRPTYRQALPTVYHRPRHSGRSPVLRAPTCDVSQVGSLPPAFPARPPAATQNHHSRKKRKKAKEKRKQPRHARRVPPFFRLLSFFSALRSSPLSVLLVRKTRCCGFAVQGRALSSEPAVIWKSECFGVEEPRREGQ